jgi:hypothetical protein
LGRFHADQASQVLREVGFEEELIAAVREINMKLGLQSNPDTATMEDALCLSFLEHEFGEFCEKHEDDKVIDIVVKTWKKMTDRGHAQALKLPLAGRSLELVQRALTSGGSNE